MTAPNIVTKWSASAPQLRSVLRIVAAFIFIQCFVWLYFSAAGAGPWSLDAKRGR